MNFKTTAVLLAALVVLGLVLLLLPDRSQKRTDSTGQDEKKLFEVDAKDVTKVTIAPADGKRTVLVREGQDWRLQEPIAAAADTYTVDSLVRAVTELRSRGEVDKSGTGVDKPRYVVEFATKDGKTKSLKIGDRSSIGDTLYVLVGDASKATVVSAELVDQHLDKPLSSLRQTKLVSANANDIRQIEITRPDGKLALRKVGENWEVTEPEKMPAEASEASDLASAIAYLSAVEYVNNESEIFAPLRPTNNPKLTVWYSTAAPATQPATGAATRPAGATLRFGGYDSVAKKNVYVAVSDPPAIAKVAATSMDAFNKKPLDLRDRKVVDVDPAQVSRLSILTNKPATTQPTTQPASRSELVIVRKTESEIKAAEAATTRPAATRPTTAATTKPAETQPTTAPAAPSTVWALKSGPGGDASQSKVEAVLSKFHPLRADKYVQASAATTKPSANYVIEITTVAPGGAQAKHEIRLVDPGEEKPLVGQYQNLTFEVPRTLVENFGDDFSNK